MKPAEMRLSDFAYELPAELIAQAPAAERAAARLLVLDRGRGALAHRAFRDLPGLLRPGDVLVLNDTKVIPARLEGHWETGGAVEVLLVREVEPAVWEAMLKPAAHAHTGRLISFGEMGDGVQARVAAIAGPGRRLLRFDEGTDVRALMDRHGRMPLPPYIRRPESRVPGRESKVRSPGFGPRGPGTRDSRLATRDLDRERYQTVYAREEGAIAAPTAGLHFTGALLDAVGRAGVEVRRVTLHVGVGTFTPIRVERLQDHRMESERYAIPEATAQAVKAARAEGRRVVAVGTTVVRSLEQSALGTGEVQAGPAEATLFITPGHRFRVVDAMLTNFHLPDSTPLVLITALAGLDWIKTAYAEALARRYRFYSYGDAMLIL